MIDDDEDDEDNEDDDVDAYADAADDGVADYRSC